MSADAWGDTDEGELIDGFAFPLAAELADIRDEISRRLATLRDQYKTVDENSIHAGQRKIMLSACIDELVAIERYVQDTIAFQLGDAR